MRTLASPAGAVLTIICFFLPWARISCAPVLNRTVSGASLGGIFWLVPLLAGVVLAVHLVSRRLGAPGRSWPASVLASVAAMGIIAVQTLRLASRSRFGIGADDVGFSLEIGGLGTAIGLVVTMAGGILLRPWRTGADTDNASNGGKRHSRQS